jgi:hypothetical protein
MACLVTSLGVEVWRVPIRIERLETIRLAVAALVCGVALGACAREIGQPIDAAAVGKLTPGRSTYADVVSQFGKAVRVRGHGSGTVAHWQYLKDTPDGTEYESLRIVFDKNGRMVRIIDWLDSGDEEAAIQRKEAIRAA